MENTIGTALGNLLGTAIKTLGLVDVYVGLREGAAVPLSEAEEARNRASDASKMLNTMVSAAVPGIIPMVQEWITKGGPERLFGREPSDDGERSGRSGDDDRRFGVVTLEFGADDVSATLENTPFKVTGAKLAHEALRGLATLLEDDYNKTMQARQTTSEPATGNKN